MLHEKLHCYQMALDLAKTLTKEVARWPSGYYYLADQVKRSISSVVLNCAEGSGRQGVRDRKRFFQIARASLIEVAACVDLMLSFQIISVDKSKVWKESLDQISRMLYFLK